MDCRGTDLAYCAALFDAEGCISVSPYTTLDGRERFHNDLWLGIQNRAALEFFQRTVGTGTISRRKDLWMWSAAGPNAVHAMRAVFPYLRIKKGVGESFLTFAATFTKGPKPTPLEIITLRKALSEHIRCEMKRDASAFHTNGVKSVNVLGAEEHGKDHTEPSGRNGAVVLPKAYRLGGEDPTNTPPTSAPPEREEIVGAVR